MMTPHEELQALLQETTEHLRYYEELGITHFGETFSPPQLPTVLAEETRPATQAESELFINFPLVEAMSQTKQTTTDLPSLFDEAAPLLPEQVVDDSLEKIRADLGDCHRCKLWQTRTNIVFGEGSATAQLMIVGEAPGADEDASGRPFVGRAGQLLTKMIEAINFKREDVYIANILKSRPPDNRNPEADETKACIPFLYRQIAAIKPKLIVTLGNPATQGLLETKVGITKLRGEFQDYPRFPGIKVLPTFHPAYLLRSPDKKREAWEDLKKVKAFLLG